MTEVRDVAYRSDRHKLQVIYYDGKNLRNIDEIVTSVSISGDVAVAHRECTVNFKNTQTGRKRLIGIENGKELRVIYKDIEVFRGVIFKNDRNAIGDESLTAYDTNVYLTKNNVNVKYVNRTATQIIKDLCGKFGVKTGNIANTSFKIPRYIMRNKSIYDVFITALTMTQKVTGKRYMLRNNKGKLEIIEVRPAKEWIRFESGRNLLSASMTESIEDVKTQIEYTGGDENKPIKHVTKKDTDKYGIMQHVEHNTDAIKSALPGLAKALLDELSKPSKEISISVLGMPAMISGEAVIAKDELSGISGTYFVMSDSHNYDSSGVHTMDLKLSKTLDLPVMEYEPPNEESSNSSGLSGSGSGKSIAESANYEKGWIGTAYDPMLGGINTSGNPLTTATSTRWSYNRTIAVDPRVIPYGSIVAIKVPSLPQYNGVYIAEDTGGAIKGKRIDVLIRGSQATRTFGRRSMEVAVLKRGTGAPSARANVKNWASLKSMYTKPQKTVSSGGSGSASAGGGKAAAIVRTANSYKGKLRYVFGGKNLSSGGVDCSGFTTAIYSQHGINIGHGTSNQATRGRKVSKADAQPGDLVFFQGTYRAGVSHVGIVTRPGYCVSMASSGCQEHSYVSGYWGKHFMQIRRVL